MDFRSSKRVLPLDFTIVSRSLAKANANDNNKGIVKKLWLLMSDFICHVFGMGAAFSLLSGMIWGETVLSSRTDMYFQSSVDKDCGKLLSSLSQSF